LTYEVLAVRYGTWRTRKSHLYHRYEAYGEPDAEATIDYFLWVVRGGSQTLVIDTGFDPLVGGRRGRTCLCPPREALARAGVEPESVRRLLLTHLHYDHTGNVDAFPAAELLVPERELEFWTGPVARHVQFASHAEASEIALIDRAAREGRVTTIAGRTSVAPGLTAIPVGGHSPGQQVLLVETASGSVVLTSDAVHFYEELELDRPFGVIANLEEMYQGYELVRELAAEPGAVLLVGHDPEVAERFPSLGGEADGIAYRIA
jgi:glyoxylase-like metal-dependent hydrolase (beta-lactamase superfamily II)